MSDENILEALETLREADQDLEAPPAVEERLIRTYRAQLRQRRWMRAYACVAAVAAAVVIAVVLQPRKTRPVFEAPSAPVTPAVAPQIVPEVRPRRPRPVQIRRTAAPQPHEVYTDFYPLIDLAPPLERGELVRVTVPASAMRQVGMLVMASHLDDPVEADVLIGQDGLARAIRFVTYQ